MSRPRRLCTWGACTEPHKAKGLCRLHYQRQKYGRDMDAPLWQGHQGCDFPGCPFPHQARGWCNTHAKRFYTTGSVGGPIKPRRCRVCGERITGRRVGAESCSGECRHLAVMMQKCQKRNPLALFHVTADREESVRAAVSLEVRGLRRLRGKHNGRPDRYTARRYGKLYVIRWMVTEAAEDEQEAAA